MREPGATACAGVGSLAALGSNRAARGGAASAGSPAAPLIDREVSARADCSPARRLLPVVRAEPAPEPRDDGLDLGRWRRLAVVEHRDLEVRTV